MSWASRWHFQHSTFHQQVSSFPIGGGVGGSQNLGVAGVDEGGVRVAVSGDGGGAGDVSDTSVVEGDAALTGKGESVIIRCDGGVGGA
jgi:hypothetical protein